MPQRSPGRYSRLHTETSQAAAQRRGGLGPLPASDHAALSSALPGSHHPHGYGVYLDQRTSLDLGCLRPGGFRPLPPPIPQAFLPLEKNGAAAGADRRFASGAGRAVRLDDRPHGPGFFVAHTHPAWWSATWGEQIFVAHDRGGIWINSINDLNKRSSIVSFGYNRRNIRRVTEAIAAREKDTHSPM